LVERPAKSETGLTIPVRLDDMSQMLVTVLLGLVESLLQVESVLHALFLRLGFVAKRVSREPNNYEVSSVSGFDQTPLQWREVEESPPGKWTRTLGEVPPLNAPILGIKRRYALK